MRVGDSHVYQPHEIVPISGQYEVMTQSGERAGGKITCSKGDRFPSVSPPNYGFLLARQAVNQ